MTGQLCTLYLFSIILRFAEALLLQEQAAAAKLAIDKVIITIAVTEEAHSLV